MDIDKRKRRQSLKVIISETVMVLAMTLIVAVLALIVSGYWLNSDFKVERQGMLQISSLPAGADLVVDGESGWFQRTNTSKILTSGEHTISLSKEGYDSWSRTINISEGLLYRIHYPRLFLTERESEEVFDASKFNFATVSPNSKNLLLTNDSSKWSLLNLDNDKMKPTELDIAPFFSSVSLAEGATAGLFTGKIADCDWDKNSEHILFKVVDNSGALEWVLIDVINVKNSLNLTKEFGVKFEAIEILDNSASTLLAVQDGTLRKIDTRNKIISGGLAKDVVNFDHYDNEIVFSSLDKDNNFHLGIFKIDEPDIKGLDFTTEPAKVVILQFYDNKYIAVLSNTYLVFYDKEDLSKISSFNLNFAPENIEVGHNGEFITMTSGSSLATLDMEDKSVREWSVEGKKFGWLDNDMIYTVKDGELIVYDFDGLNRRALAKNVSEHFPVTITNNKWLYYFSDGTLVREVIMK